MTKTQAIEAAKKAVRETEETQVVLRLKGGRVPPVYKAKPVTEVWSWAWKEELYIGTGNVDSY
jgi:hypothetical protein